MIRLENIGKIYKLGENEFAALSDVDLHIARNEFVALTGASGSGKLTLMNILGCLDSPTTGSYSLDDEAVAGLSEDKLAGVRNRKIGFIFQNFYLMPRFTALDNVMMPMRKLGRLSAPEMEARATELLTAVGLGAKTGRLPSQLSGGEQQRVAIARSLANRPSLLLADEPTGNLDIANSTLVFDLLKSLAKEHRQAVVLVTHNPEIAARCDRTLRMLDGVFVG